MGSQHSEIGMGDFSIEQHCSQHWLRVTRIAWSLAAAKAVRQMPQSLSVTEESCIHTATESQLC